MVHSEVTPDAVPWRWTVRLSVTIYYFFVFVAFGMVIGGVGPAVSVFADNICPPNATTHRPPAPVDANTSRWSHYEQRSVPHDVLAVFVSDSDRYQSAVAIRSTVAVNSEQHEENPCIRDVGWIFTTRGIGMVIGSIVAGLLCDKVQNRHHLLNLGIVLMSLSMILAPLVGNLWLLYFIFFVQGLGCSFFDTVGNTLIVWLWAEKVSPYIQLMHFGFGVGAFVAPFLIGFLLEVLGANCGAVTCIAAAFFFIAGSVMFICSGAFIFPSTHPDSAQEHEALEAFGSDAAATSKTVGSSDASAAASERCNLSKWIVIAMVSFLLCNDVGAELGAGGWLDTVTTTSELNFTKAQGAFVTSVYWGSIAVGRAAAIILARWISNKTALVYDMVGAFVAAGIWLAWPSSPTAMWTATAILGFSMASIYPAAITLPSYYKMAVTGRQTSIFVVGASIGELAIPALMGIAIVSLGPHSFYWMMALVLFMAFVAFMVVCGVGRAVARDIEASSKATLYASEMSDISSENQPLLKLRAVDDNGSKRYDTL